ncbi:MAG: protein translocase subunit SecF, partial [Patescibacteria group bacterium]|nr:protein translocase subunit SecF [Patescibacteria group bacterium]
YMIKIVQKRKIWFAFSAVLVSASLIALLAWGLKFGIDFTGGTLMEFSFKEETLNSQEIKEALADLNLGEINIQFSGEKDVLLRFKDVDEDTHQKILTALDFAISGEDNSEENNNENKSGEEEDISEENEKENKEENNIEGIEESKPFSGFIKKALAADEEAPGETENMEDAESAEENGIKVTTESGEEININAGEIDLGNIENEEIDLDAMAGTGRENANIKEKRFNSIGPVIGNELKRSAVWAIVIALIAIVLYIGFAFRKVSFPVSSFKYGIIATIALFHDVIITLGVFAVLGHFFSIEIGIPFVAAILAILGYSVNDTIVVFDRTRENLLKSGIDDFEEVVNKSVNETLIRSINTSFTTLIVLAALYLFGGDTIRYFVVALMVGISAGTYSSIFIASPLLVTWQKWDLKRKA